MANDSEMLDLQAFVAGALSSTGEYESIEVGGEVSGSSYLNKKSRRNITARKKPEFAEDGETLDFLVIANADLMPIDLLHKKSEEAARRKIALMHILYKGGDAPFFEWDRGIFKPSRGHYSEETQRRLINTNEMERYIAELTGNEVAYFNPKAGTLEIVGFGDVVADYHHNPDVFQKERLLVRSKDHQVVVQMNFFTLQPYTRNGRILARPRRIDEGNAKSVESFFELESRQNGINEPDARTRINERISMMLDSLPDARLRKLTESYGEKKLGDYAV